MSLSEPCTDCLRRSWLLQALAGHIDCERGRLDALLALDDKQLLLAVGGRRRRALEAKWARFDRAGALHSARRAGLTAVCRCDRRYPSSLRRLVSPPAVLYLSGSLPALTAVPADTVAIVGCRKPSCYGLDVARSLGRSLAAAGLTVLSGLAVGIDSAAHEGALAAGGRTIAVLPGPAERAYPASARMLYRRIIRSGGGRREGNYEGGAADAGRARSGAGAADAGAALSQGAAISELPPGGSVRRWMFPARNRIIAALARMTVVVEGTSESGALLTARTAQAVGMEVGAVPGRVTSPQAEGPHLLLAGGARLIRGPQDVLETLFGAAAPRLSHQDRPPLRDELQSLLEAVASGQDTLDALARGGLPLHKSLEGLAALELGRYLRRAPGGRFVVLP